MEFAAFGYSCCDVTNITQLWNDVTFLDDSQSIYDIANLPFTVFNQGPANLKMGIEEVIEVALGYDSDISNNNATKILVSTLNYDIDKNSTSMCKDNYIAVELEINQIHHLLLHFDTTDGPSLNTIDPTQFPSGVPSPPPVIGRRIMIDGDDDVNMTDLERIEETLSCLIQDDNLDGNTDESYVYFGYPWEETTSNQVSNIIDNGIIDTWLTERLFQDVSVRTLGARIAGAAYGQAPDTNLLYIISGNVTFVDQETAPPTGNINTCIRSNILSCISTKHKNMCGCCFVCFLCVL